MIIKHILKDGTNVDSVDGMVISASKHKELYELINEIMKGGDDGAAVSASDPRIEGSQKP